jgi:cyclopropane fatty-acyl-phospholipid synthase-like methyltransferase
MQETKDFFAHKAKNYEQEKRRLDNVANISKLILREIDYKKDMHILDFGSGTGLLLEKIAPHIGSVTAVDISKSMNQVLKEKQHKIPCQLQIKELDLTTTALDEKFDNIISSMTIHHIKDIDKLFKIFYNLLKDNGTIALSDLDTEDGTFHTIDTGVHHFGFDREEFAQKAKNAGFKNIKTQTVGNVVKPYGEYGVFLLTASK